MCSTIHITNLFAMCLVVLAQKGRDDWEHWERERESVCVEVAIDRYIASMVLPDLYRTEHKDISSFSTD